MRSWSALEFRSVFTVNVGISPREGHSFAMYPISLHIKQKVDSVDR